MVGPVLGLEPIHSDGISCLQRILPPTLPAEAVRRATFDCIIRYLAGLVFHIDVIVDVRIRPIYFCDRACEFYGFSSTLLLVDHPARRMRPSSPIVGTRFSR